MEVCQFLAVKALLGLCRSPLGFEIACLGWFGAILVQASLPAQGCTPDWSNLGVRHLLESVCVQREADGGCTMSVLKGFKPCGIRWGWMKEPEKAQKLGSHEVDQTPIAYLTDSGSILTFTTSSSLLAYHSRLHGVVLQFRQSVCRFLRMPMPGFLSRRDGLQWPSDAVFGD